MTQPEVLDQDIRALQDWLRAAWQQLGDPALTPADLRAHLQRAEERHRQPVDPSMPSFAKPELRILAWS